MADVTDASTDASGDVFGAVRLAGGLAVEKSAHVKQKLRVLSDEDGTAAGAGALFVAGGRRRERLRVPRERRVALGHTERGFDRYRRCGLDHRHRR